MYIQCSNYLSQIFFQANKLLSISSSILAFNISFKKRMKNKQAENGLQTEPIFWNLLNVIELEGFGMFIVCVCIKLNYHVL